MSSVRPSTLRAVLIVLFVLAAVAFAGRAIYNFVRPVNKPQGGSENIPLPLNSPKSVR